MQKNENVIITGHEYKIKVLLIRKTFMFLLTADVLHWYIPVLLNSSNTQSRRRSFILLCMLHPRQGSHHHVTPTSTPTLITLTAKWYISSMLQTANRYMSLSEIHFTTSTYLLHLSRRVGGSSAAVQMSLSRSLSNLDAWALALGLSPFTWRSNQSHGWSTSPLLPPQTHTLARGM